MREALALAGGGPIGVITGIIGGQGFVFGRGNQQIGPEAIRRAGRERLIIVADIAKLTALPAARLLVDTGDPALDAALRKALKQKTGDATVLIVTQRVATVMNADQIIVLDEGRVVGKGSHRDLLETCPTYQEIATSQLSREELA